MAKKNSSAPKKVVLAYSGGLDTSVILKWLQDVYECEVITFTADIGQGEEVEPARKKAQMFGVKQIFIENLQEEFVRDFVFPMFRANTVYEGEYLLGTSIARPLIAKRLVEIAKKTGADAISHGATGKGNDQVRFELGAYALMPDVKVIAPWREWDLLSREKLLAYADQHKIPVDYKKRKGGGVLSSSAVETVTAEKKQIIRKSGLLEYYDNTELIEHVGGLTTLKGWLRKRVRAFTDEARAFGLPAPKGILLVGVQGCGKSLIARSVAGMWRLPLLRLDAGRLFSSLVGSSEDNLRHAIRTAESVAPAVLWVDEIEKGFAGVGSSNISDAGTAARVFGSFVTWLQEKQKPVFVVATANHIGTLPPELVRKGRFDEIFFVDLPSAVERAEIWRIHLARRNRDPDQFDLTTLAMASEGLSGAEIEQAVIAGLYEAFDAGRPLVLGDLLDVLNETVPLSAMMREELDGLRNWAKRRARPASQ